MTLDRATPDLGARLIDEHRHLDALFDRLLVDFRIGDYEACRATWGHFEQELLGHLEFEEIFLLPKFEVTYAAETTVLRRQRAKLRNLLAELGVRIELHAVKEETVRNLVYFLRGHAVREEDLLYRWSSDLPADTARSLVEQAASVDSNFVPQD